jgi:hypothetical protein
MTRRITEIMKLVSPPVERPDSNDWPAAEASLLIEFPSDYKAFIGHYGSGYAGDYLAVHSPFSNEIALSELLEYYRLSEAPLFDEFKELYGLYRPWPEPNGLLPFARTPGAGLILWKTGGESDSWTTVIQDGCDFEEHPFGFVETLAKIITGREGDIFVT